MTRFAIRHRVTRCLWAGLAHDGSDRWVSTPEQAVTFEFPDDAEMRGVEQCEAPMALWSVVPVVIPSEVQTFPGGHLGAIEA